MCGCLPNGGCVENRLTGLAFIDRSKNFYAINTFREDSGPLRAGRMAGKIGENEYGCKFTLIADLKSII